MPWKECHVMDERLRFVARLLDGEKMAALCAEFGILAQDRLQDLRALQGLRRRRAHRSQSPAAIGRRISCRCRSRSGSSG